MKHDYTYLARPLGPLPKKSFFGQLFDPLHARATRYLQETGLMSMLTYSYQGGVSGNTSAGVPVFTNAGLSVCEVNLDFAAIAAARLAAGQAALGSGDILTLVGIPAGVYVLAAAIEVTKAEGAAATAGLGDGGDTSGFIAAANLNVVGWYGSLVTSAYSVAVGGGKLYVAADTIDMILNSAAINVAVCRVVAVMMDMRSSR